MAYVFLGLLVFSIIGVFRPFKSIPIQQLWHYGALVIASFVGIGLTVPKPTPEELKAKGEAAAAGIVAYERDDFPTLFEAVGPDLFSRIAELEVGAVYAAAESSRCDKVQVSGASDQSSMEDGLVWFVDCENGNRFMISQAQAEEALARFNSGQLAQTYLSRSCTTETVARCDPENAVAAEQEEENPLADTSRQYAWVAVSQDAVRERLRDPDSAQFRNVHFYSGSGTPVACGEVNAKNAFGGYTGYEQFVAAGSEFAFLASDMTSNSEWADVWNRFCTKAPTDEA